MDWLRYVRGEKNVVREKSNSFYLDKIMAELLDNNTLANWVWETNEKISVQ